MKVLYLHIGTHKTGTTSFQRFMVDHSDFLQGKGIWAHLEDRGSDLDGNSMQFAHTFVRQSVMSFARIRGDVKSCSLFYFFRSIYSLKHKANRSLCPKLLMSAEAFCFLRTTSERFKIRILSFLLNVKIVPIIVFRNESDWRASWRNQIAKDVRTRSVLSEKGFNILGDWYFNKSDIIKFWSAIDSPIILNYDKISAGEGDIVAAILKSLDVDPPPGISYRMNTRDFSVAE